MSDQDPADAPDAPPPKPEIEPSPHFIQIMSHPNPYAESRRLRAIGELPATFWHDWQYTELAAFLTQVPLNYVIARLAIIILMSEQASATDDAETALWRHLSCVTHSCNTVTIGRLRAVQADHNTWRKCSEVFLQTLTFRSIISLVINRLFETATTRKELEGVVEYLRGCPESVIRFESIGIYAVDHWSRVADK